jgi:predicted AlkP superfamily phosphohydrolase/phosphomutase/tetratricopeptide (TPR) repeat protein
VSLALAVSLCALACSLDPGREARPRIVVIGWDGADWQAVRDLIDKGRMPHLARLVEQGASGRLRTYEPMLSPLIWTSIATGKEPPAHGILDFLTVDESTGTIVPITSDKRRTKALWNILGDYGLRSGFVGWLVTFPAEQILGHIVSERVSILSFAQHRDIDTSPPEGKTYPQHLYEEIKPLIVQPGEVSDETVRERFGLEALPAEDKLSPLRGTLAQTETYRRITLQLLERQDVDLFATYFEAIDAISHLFIRYTPPLMPGTSEEDLRSYGQIIEYTYAYLDGILGEIVEQLPHGTTVYVVSDHGFKMGEERILFEDSSMQKQYAADWHRDNGVLVVQGPGVRSGQAIDDAHVFDITPTLLAQLGIPSGRDMPGRALVEIWRPDDAPAVPEPVETHDAGDWQEASDNTEFGSSADDEKLKEKLQALGYVRAGRAAAHSNEYTNLANYFAYREAYPRALQAVRTALDANPKNSNAWKTLGEIQIRLGQYDEAIDALTQVIALRRDTVEVHRTLAGLYEQVGEHSRAIEILEPLAERYPDDPRIPARLGTLYARGGEYDEACRQYERSLLLYPRQDRVRYELLAARAFNGEREEVLGWLEEQSEEATIDFALELGKVFFKLGDEAKAAAAFDLAIRRDDGKAEIHFYRGLLQMSRRETQSALESFDAALRLEPNYTAARLNKGLAFIRAGRMEEAIATLLRILEDDPGYAPAHTFLGEAYLASGKTTEARGHLERALELDPQAMKARALLKEIPTG